MNEWIIEWMNDWMSGVPIKSWCLRSQIDL
jgi:hypothetical protein